jgi:hypothetical protein
MREVGPRLRKTRESRERGGDISHLIALLAEDEI